ncbi:MAG: hypothetical protein HKN91_17335 [Acidimicrobiia bacterium]|nr:hypothetical protein [Acidimicrobiia bacterium]
MSEALLFAVGSIMFIVTSGATVYFGMSRMHELQRVDLEMSPRVVAVDEGQYTEVYRTQRLEDDVEPSPAE